MPAKDDSRLGRVARMYSPRYIAPIVLSRVFVTGVGVVSSIGLGREAFFRALEKGRSGISPVGSFDTSSLGRQLGGEVKDFEVRDHLTHAEQRRMGRCSALALAAARMALADAGLGDQQIAGPRTAVVLGTTMGEAQLQGDLQKRWIVDGPDAVRASLIPKVGSTLLPIHVARAV